MRPPFFQALTAAQEFAYRCVSGSCRFGDKSPTDVIRHYRVIRSPSPVEKPLRNARLVAATLHAETIPNVRREPTFICVVLEERGIASSYKSLEASVTTAPNEFAISYRLADRNMLARSQHRVPSRVR